MSAGSHYKRAAWFTGLKRSENDKHHSIFGTTNTRMQNARTHHARATRSGRPSSRRPHLWPRRTTLRSRRPHLRPRRTALRSRRPHLRPRRTALRTLRCTARRPHLRPRWTSLLRPRRSLRSCSHLRHWCSGLQASLRRRRATRSCATCRNQPRCQQIGTLCRRRLFATREATQTRSGGGLPEGASPAAAGLKPVYAFPP